MDENNKKNIADSMKDVASDAVKNIKNMSADDAKKMANEKLDTFKKLEPRKQAIYLAVVAVVLFGLISMFSSKSAYDYMEEFAQKKFECYEIQYMGKKIRDADDIKELYKDYQECGTELQELQKEMMLVQKNFDKEDLKQSNREAKKLFKSLVKELKANS